MPHADVDMSGAVERFRGPAVRAIADLADQRVKIGADAMQREVLGMLERHAHLFDQTVLVTFADAIRSIEIDPHTLQRKAYAPR